MSEFHDDIFEAEKTEIKNYHPYVGPWSCDPTKYKVTGGIKQLRQLAGSKRCEELYLFNSEVLICCNSYNDDILLILPQAKIVIDYNDSVKNEYKEKEEILSCIGCKDYSFYYLHDVDNTIKVLKNISPIKRFPISIRNKNDITVIAQGSYLFGNDSKLKGKEHNFQTNLFNILFLGEHNWRCNQSYAEEVCVLEQSLMPCHIFCYEDSSYIKKEDGYCIEKLTLDESKFDFDKYDWNTPTRIAIFSKDGDAIKYYGVFRLDKDKSRSNNALTFKHSTNELKIYEQQFVPIPTDFIPKES